MLVRDGRNAVHDLGARRTFMPSMLRMIGGEGTTGSGGWTRDSHVALFTRKERPPARTDAEQRAVERQDRWDNIEHYRAQERARQARYRARKREVA